MVTILKSYAGEMFFEFVRHKTPTKAIILLPGFPSNNNYEDLINYFYNNGFNVFFPRYLGSFQSKGNFLEKDPSEDISKFVNFLKKGKCINLWDEETKQFENTEYVFVTGSFGGAVALGASTKTDVSKIILFSPVWDFTLHNKEYSEQDLKNVTKFVKRAWINLYRYDFEDIQEKMSIFESCKWSNYSSGLTDKKIMVLHDPKDSTTSIEHSKKFCKELDCSLIEHNKGHGMNIEIINSFEDKLLEFI